MRTCILLVAAACSCAPSSDGSGVRPFDLAGNGGGADLTVSSTGGDMRSSSTGGDMRTSSTGGDMSASTSPDLAIGAGTFAAMCNGQSTTLTGVVTAPNGSDPVPLPNAYIARKVNPFTPGVACDLCDRPIDDVIIASTPQPDGKFSLSLDSVPYGSTVQFVVSKGRFRKVTQLAVRCGANTVPSQASRLPGKSSDGDIPKMAVGTGNSDHLDEVLVALGITEFTCLEGRKSTTRAASCTTTGKLSDLLTNKNGLTLTDYNMVFISCAPGAYANYATTGVSTATISANLMSWTALGGRLFVTDNSYDYVSQAFPSAFSWQGPPQASGVWPIDGANVGVGGTSSAPATMSATVDDPDLTAWLQVVGVSSAPMVTIGGLLSNWSVQAAPEPTGTTQLVDGVATYTVSGAQTMSDVPLTSQLDVNMCGKVAYSSYHTLSTVNTTSLSAQERILEYLILEISACTGPG